MEKERGKEKKRAAVLKVRRGASLGGVGEEKSEKRRPSALSISVGGKRINVLPV